MTRRFAPACKIILPLVKAQDFGRRPGKPRLTIRSCDVSKLR